MLSRKQILRDAEQEQLVRGCQGTEGTKLVLLQKELLSGFFVVVCFGFVFVLIQKRKQPQYFVANKQPMRILQPKIYVWEKPSDYFSLYPVKQGLEQSQRARLDGLLAPCPVVINNGAMLPGRQNQVSRAGLVIQCSSKWEEKKNWQLRLQQLVFIFLNIQVLRWELQGPVVEALPLLLSLCPWSSGRC